MLNQIVLPGLQINVIPEGFISSQSERKQVFVALLAPSNYPKLQLAEQQVD